MRIVLWLGSDANQKALANQIHANFPIEGFVVENPPSKKSAGGSIAKIAERILAPAQGKAWREMLHHFKARNPQYPPRQSIVVENINSGKTISFTKNIAPDLIIVSGTSAIRERLLQFSPSIGILNLHTGLLPYVNGGPNCTDWCIASGQFHLIGNTANWLKSGPDGGNIFASECTEFSGEENLSEVYIEVMEHAHDLFVRSIAQIAKGKMSAVPAADISEGTVFKTSDWTLRQKMRLQFNFRKFRRSVKSGAVAEKRKEIVSVSASYHFNRHKKSEAITLRFFVYRHSENLPTEARTLFMLTCADARLVLNWQAATRPIRAKALVRL